MSKTRMKQQYQRNYSFLLLISELTEIGIFILQKIEKNLDKQF